GGVDRPVAVVKLHVLLVNLPDDLAGVSGSDRVGGDIAGDDAPGADDAVLPDGDAGADDAVGPDPAVVADGDVGAVHIPPQVGVNGVADGGDGDRRAEHHPVANGDPAVVDKVAVDVD